MASELPPSAQSGPDVGSAQVAGFGIGREPRKVRYAITVTGQNITIDPVLSGVAYTAFRANQDVTTGVYARLLTLPIVRGALGAARNLSSVVAIVGVGFGLAAKR